MYMGKKLSFIGIRSFVCTAAWVGVIIRPKTIIVVANTIEIIYFTRIRCEYAM